MFTERTILFRRLAMAWSVIIVLAANASMISAQSTFATVTGTVTDPTGAVIPNATIVITNKRTEVSRSLVSDAEGNYLIVNLDPGVYTVEIEAKGFAKSTRSVELLARQIVRIDVRVETAATTERVEILATSPITTESPTIADSKSGREINELALNFRATNAPSPIVVATLAPGVQQDRAGNISVAGGQPYTTSFSIDGISSQNVRGGAAVRDLFPSVEGIAEFRVSSINNNAEFGQVSDITTISKSGSNDYHGTAFWFHQNSALNATNPFGPVGANGKRIRPPARANSFGGALSGPLTIPGLYNARNKSFFFFDYEGVRRPDNVTLNQIVPPDAFRSGNLSSITAALRNPFTGGTYANNQIPVNPASAKVLDLLFVRQNQATGTAINRPNFVINVPTSYTVNGWDLRLDHNFSDKHKVFGRYTHKNVESAGTDGGGNYNTLFGEYTSTTQVRNLAGSYSWIISPSLVNEFRGGFTINDIFVSYPLASNGSQITQQIGLTGLPKAPPLGGIPNFFFTDGSFIASNSTGRPRKLQNTTWQFNNTLTWTRGRHSLKGGFDFQKLSFKDYLSFYAGDDFGEYQFTGIYTGNAFADFLLGLPSVTYYAANGPDTNPYAFHYAAFIQDDFRISPKLTINYGLRYEVHPPFNDNTRQLTNFDRNFKGGRVVVQDEKGLAQVAPSFKIDIGSTPIVLAKDAGLPVTLRNTDWNDFNPRFGFAYRPFGDNKTVVRGGIGVYTVTVLGSVLYSLAGVATSNAPVYANQVNNGQFRLLLPNAFPAGTAAGSGGIPDFRRANQIDLTDPYSYQWNLTIEREMWWNTGLRLTYTGSKTRNLVHSPDLNQVRPNTQGYDAVRATRPFPNFNAVLTRDNGPSAKYHAFTTEFSRRFSAGVSFQSSYTLTKNLSNVGGPAPGGFAAENGPTTLNIFDIAADYGDVAFSRRHRFLTTFLWELPFGRGRKLFGGVNGVVNQFIGEWQMNGILLFQSGPYLTPTFTGTDPSGTGVLVRGVTTTQRPDRIGNGNLSKPTIDAYFDRGAFVRPANNIGRFGNAGVGILRGPGTDVFSMTLAKQFSITEKLKLRYEAAFANLFNHLNPDIPGTLNITSSAFGRITRTQTADQAGPRTIQMSLRISF